MNLFDKIISGANYLKSGKLGEDIFDATYKGGDATKILPYKAVNTLTKGISKVTGQGMQDPTQSLLFKGVQGAANVYTGTQKMLQGAYESDIASKQSKVDEEGMQFAQHLASKGYSKEQIFSALDNLKKEGKLTVTPNFAERLVGGLANRMGEAQRTTERLYKEGFDPLAGKVTAKGLITAPVSYGGDVVGTAFEPVAAAVSPLIQSGIKKLGQEENVAKLGSEWEEIRQKYPNFADFAEGIANISSLIPLSPKVTSPISAGIKTAGAKTLDIAKQVTPYIKPNLSKQSKKLISQSDMGFRKQAEEIALPKLSEMGMREKQKVVGDVVETKPGLFKKEELVRNPQEALAIEEVSRMLKEGKIKKGGTELQKSVAISDEITGLAEALKGRLDNTPNPVAIPKADIDSLLNTISQNIDRNPFLKAGELDRSAQQIIKNIRDQLTKDTYTPSELLDIRKQLDADIKTYKGEKAFSPDIENAFSTTLRDIRQGINNKISELVPDADVRDFLDRQSALYIARDNVDLKWTKQANSLIGRTLTKIQSATGIPRTEIIELSTALGLLGASSLAPIVAPIAIGATAVVGGKKALGAILSPKNKARLANVLSKLDEAIKKNPKDAELKKAKELLTNPPKNGNTPTRIRNSSNNRPGNTQPIVKPSPQVKPVEKTVKPKNLTEGKQSATMGDMETKNLIEEARKIGVDINKYFENVSEKSAIKMADYASDIVGKKMIKGERPMDMSELGMLSNKINKNESGGNITTIGDIIKDSDLRKLYEKALDTPITILDERVARKGQLGGYVPMGEGRYGGHIVLFGGNKEISNNLPKTILHEAAHAIRDSKGRKLEVDYR